MGRQPTTGSVGQSTGQESEADGPTIIGDHSPEGFVLALLERVRCRSSGVLTVRHDAHSRQISLFDGAPVAVLTTLAEESLAATLVASGRVDARRVAWMEKHCGPDEPLVEGLLEAGSLSQSDLDTHLQTHLYSLIGASLGWSSGEWTWEEAVPGATERFDPTLLPQIDPLEALIHGVLQAFEREALRTFTQDTDAGNFVADPSLTGSRPPHWLPLELNKLPERLATGADARALAESLSMDPDRVCAILWLLEAAGLVHRRSPPAALVPVSSVATILPPAPAAKPRPGRVAKPKKIKARGSKQAAVPAPSAAAEPTAAPPKAATPAEAATPAKAAAPPRPKRSPAPRTKPAPKKRGPKPTFDRAEALLHTEDFEAAFVMLSQLRHIHPSCPDTLAALGWAGWKTGNHGTNAYDSPDDFLLLALTFDPAHAKALEYFARMAMDQGDVETARNRVLQLLQVTPDSLWAREALEGELASKSKRGLFGARFWPKSSS